MKKRLTIKNLIWILALFPAFFLFFSQPIKAEADDACQDPNTLAVDLKNIERNSDFEFKVMPGDVIEADVKNNCASKGMKLNIYVYPEGKLTGPGSIDPYLKYENQLIAPGAEESYNITIFGNEGPGTYYLRIVAFLVDENGTAIRGPYIDETSLIVATEGIVFADSCPTNIVKDQGGDFTIKIYGHQGETFSIYIDQIDDFSTSGEYPHKKVSDVLISSDPYTYNYHWNTSGTDLGGHKFIVVIGNSLNKSFNVNVKNAASSGGTSSGGAINTLNQISIRGLINRCGGSGANFNLTSIICVVEVLIDWALDVGAVLAFIMILYASIVYLTSYGDESKAEVAKKTLIWSVIGVIVIGVAMAIMRITENILNNPTTLK